MHNIIQDIFGTKLM